METSTRLRKAFKYPADEDSDSEPEGIDEEEQEQLIKTFIEQDAAKTEAYKKAFLALPCLSILLYIPSLLSPSSTSSAINLLLGVTSLVSTAYALYASPSHASPKPATQSFAHNTQSPLEKYLDHLNAGVCIILLLSAWGAKRAGREEDMWLSVLSPAVFLVIYFARTQLRPVDVSELEKLKYGYKGA